MAETAVKFTCTICGAVIESEIMPDVGQHVLCPFCNGKFTYHGGASASEHSASARNDVPASTNPPHNKVQRHVIGGVLAAAAIMALVVAIAFCAWHFRKEPPWHASSESAETEGSARLLAEKGVNSGLASKVDELKVDNDRLGIAIEQLRKDVENARAGNDRLNQECARLHKECERLNNDNVQLRKENEELRVKFAMLPSVSSISAPGDAADGLAQVSQLPGSQVPAEENVDLESPKDIKRQIDKNLDELKMLRQDNPMCILEKNLGSIRNLQKRMTPNKLRAYCAKSYVTHVRDMFHCSACGGETSLEMAEKGDSCCNVSKKQSFAAWMAARRSVDETERINERIDELLSENKALADKLQGLKKQ